VPSLTGGQGKRKSKETETRQRKKELIGEDNEKEDIPNN